MNKMWDKLVRKTLVLTVIVLFTGASIVPSIGENIEEIGNKSELKITENVNLFNNLPEEEWNKTFGEVNQDFGRSVQQVSDGGYIIAGYTYSYGAGHHDVWLIKTDANGNEQWNKTFGGEPNDRCYSAQQVSDGGYIMTGDTRSYGAGDYDVWLIKTDSSGNMEWNKTFGGSLEDFGNSTIQTSDGGYIITYN